MNSSRTPVNWLRAFEVAARHLSFSAAATELNVTPAAVSQQVRLLEQRLGEQLFARHARGLRLTRAGETLVPACRESFERLDGALAELFGRRRRDQLVMRVALGFARQWLLGRIAAFSRHIRTFRFAWWRPCGRANRGCQRRPRHTARVWPGARHDLASPDAGRDLSGMQSGAGSRHSPHPPASRLAHHALLHTIGFAQGWKHWFAAAWDDRRGQRRPGVRLDAARARHGAPGHGVALARSSYAEDLLRSRDLKDCSTSASRRATTLPDAFAWPGPCAPAALFRDWMLAQPERHPRRHDDHRRT